MNQEILSLKRNSPEFYSVLIEGTVLKHGEPWAALPREVVSNSNEIESVIFEVVRPQDLIKPSLIRVLWKAIRPESLTVILTPSLAVFLYARCKHWAISWEMGGLALFGVLFFQIAVNALNDVEDHLRLIDLPNSHSGSGVIQKGWLSAAQLKRFGYGAFATGAVLGLFPVLRSPEILIWVGGIGALGVWAYSGKPMGIKYRAWGDLSVFLLLGPLLCVGLSQSAFRQFDLSVILLGLFFGFTTYGIVHAKNFKNGNLSRSEGNSLASWVGFKKSRHIFVGLYGLAYCVLLGGVLWGGLPDSVGIGLLVGTPWVIRFLLRIYKASGPVSALLVFIRSDAAKLHLWLGALICISLLISFISTRSV